MTRTARNNGVVLTYDVRRDELGDTGKSLRDFLTRFVTEVDEPFATRFTTAEIVDLLGAFGFRDITEIGPREAADRYFPGRADVRFGGGQGIIVATVGSLTAPTQRWARPRRSSATERAPLRRCTATRAARRLHPVKLRITATARITSAAAGVVA